MIKKILFVMTAIFYLSLLTSAAKPIQPKEDTSFSLGHIHIIKGFIRNDGSKALVINVKTKNGVAPYMYHWKVASNREGFSLPDPVKFPCVIQFNNSGIYKVVLVALDSKGNISVAPDLLTVVVILHPIFEDFNKSPIDAAYYFPMEYNDVMHFN